MFFSSKVEAPKTLPYKVKTKRRALTLDLALRFGLLEKDGKGNWKEGPRFEAKRMHFICEVADNADKCATEILNNFNLSADADMAKTTDMFTYVFQLLMVIPSDWHAGLSMLQFS